MKGFDYAGFREKMLFYRDKIGFSQAELADKANITATQMGKIERGEAEPNLETVIGILNAFHMDLDTFMNGDSKTKKSILIDDIQENLEHMSDRDVLTIQALSDTLYQERLKELKKSDDKNDEEV